MNKQFTFIVYSKLILAIFLSSLLTPVNADTKIHSAPVSSALPIGITDYTLISYNLTELVDNDNDGYFSSATLNITVSVGEENAGIGVIAASVCKYPDEIGPCPYATTEMPCFNDTSTFSIPLGLPNNELERNTYQIKFMVYEYIESYVVFDWTDVETIQMETQEEDNPVVIDSCYWETESSLDCDGDGFMSLGIMTIHFKETPASGSIRAEIWAEDNTEPHKITIYEELIEFPAYYHFMDVWGPATLETPLWVALIDPSNQDTLVIYKLPGIHYMEDPNQDNYSITCSTGYEYSISEFGWADKEYADYDGDGYYSLHRLNINVDCDATGDSDNRYVYVKVYASTEKGKINEQCLYYTSSNYWPDWKVELTKVKFGDDNGELPRGKYYITVQVIDSETDELFIEDTTLDVPLYFEPFDEDFPEDAEICISDVEIDEKIDMDHDGYSRVFNMYIEADVTSGSYDVRAKILYKGSNENEYHRYSTSPTFTITNNEIDTYKTSIGGKYLGGLGHDKYDFKIELYLRDRLVAVRSDSSDSDISDLCLESPMEDSPIKIDTFYWSKMIDCDGDGSFSYGELTVKLNVIEITDSISVYLCAYPAIVSYSIIVSLDTVTVFPGENTVTLKVENQHFENWNPHLYILNYDTDHPLISGTSDSVYNCEYKYEDVLSDVDFWISDVYTDEKIDFDNDGCMEKCNLYFDANVSCGTFDVWAKVYYKLSTEKDWIEYKSTETYTITGDETDYHMVTIGPDSRFAHNEYDFAVELYHDSSIVAEICPYHDCDIKQLCFETQAEDMVVTIDTCYWTNIIDCDADGFIAYGTLVVHFKETPPDGQAYMHIWFLIPDRPEGSQESLIEGLLLEFPLKQYEVDLWAPGVLATQMWVVVSADEYCNNRLATYYIIQNQKFEDPNGDHSVSLNKTEWISEDGIDKDGDGYFSKQKLNVNFNSCPLSLPVYFEVSACKHPDLDGPCLYYTTPLLNPDIPDDVYIDFGDENGELSHGMYYIFLRALDYKDKVVMNYQPLPEPAYFETENEDIPVTIEHTTINSLEVYPNPFTSKLYIKLFPEDVNERYSIQLLNINGAVAKILYDGIPDDTYSELYDLEDLKSGVYILRVMTSKEFTNMKLLKY